MTKSKSTCIACVKEGYRLVKCPIPEKPTKLKTKAEKDKDLRKAVKRREKNRNKLFRNRCLLKNPRLCETQGKPISDDGGFPCFDAFDMASTFSPGFTTPTASPQCCPKKNKNKKNKKTKA